MPAAQGCLSRPRAVNHGRDTSKDHQTVDTGNRLGRNRSGIGGASPEHCPGGILRLCINLRRCEPGAHDRGLTGLAGQSALLAPPVSLQIGTALGVADGWLAKPLAGNGHSTTPQQARLSRCGWARVRIAPLLQTIDLEHVMTYTVDSYPATRLSQIGAE